MALLLLFLIALVYSLVDFIRRPKLYTISAFSDYERLDKGRARAVFYEYEASYFRGQDLEAQGVQGRRYRVNDELLALDRDQIAALFRYNEEIKKQVHNEALTPSARDQLRLESQYYEEVIRRRQVYMPFSGLVSVSLDGLEPFLLPGDLNRLSGADSLPQEALHQQPGLKFVDNRLYYLLVDLPKTCRKRTWTPGQTYRLRMGDTDYRGTLERYVSGEGGQDFLIFSLREGFSVWAERRIQDLAIVRDQEKVYGLPRDSIFQEDGLYYCYMMNAAGQARKLPVYPLDFDFDRQEWILDAKQRLDDQGLPIRTVQVLDKVVADPEGIEEGDYLR